MFFVNGCASQEHNLVAPGIQVLKISLNEDNHSLLLHDCSPFRFRYNFHFIKGKLGKCFFYIFLYVLRIKILLLNEGLKKGHE